MSYYACGLELSVNILHLWLHSPCLAFPFRTAQFVFVNEKLPISTASFPHHYPLNMIEYTFGFFEFEEADSVLPDLLSLFIKSIEIKTTLTFLLFLKHILKESYSRSQLPFTSSSRTSLRTIVSELMLKLIILFTLESKLSSHFVDLRDSLSLNICNNLLSFFR
jgi:hypothetical protein